MTYPDAKMTLKQWRQIAQSRSAIVGRQAQEIADLTIRNEELAIESQARADMIGSTMEEWNDLREHNDTLKKRVEGLREIVDHYSTFTRYLANSYPEIYNSDECMAYEDVENVLTLPCPECGTVGGGGTVSGDPKNIEFGGWLPCPTCGTKEKP